MRAWAAGGPRIPFALHGELAAGLRTCRSFLGEDWIIDNTLASDPPAYTAFRFSCGVVSDDDRSNTSSWLIPGAAGLVATDSAGLLHIAAGDPARHSNEGFYAPHAGT